MSSNRVIIDSNGRHFCANSFDRFGDDLTELLLSYLTFDDKIRLECVSKQWTRLILNKQFVFNYCPCPEKIEHDGLFLQRPYKDPKIFNISFKNLLNKCFIRRIDFAFVHLDYTLLDIISDCCPLLESIAGNFSELRTDAIVKFGKKLGNRMKTIHFRGLYSKNELILIGFCPNIIELSSDDFIQEKHRKLQPMFKLKKLCFKTHSIDSNIFDAIKQLAPNLKHLEIVSSWLTIDLNIDIGSATPMSNLVVFKMAYLILTNLSQPVRKGFLNLSKLMPNLKVLKLLPPTDVNQNAFECLTKMSKLTQLVIIYNQPFIKTLSDFILQFLFENLPKLKKIKINSPINMSDKLINKLIEIANNRRNEKFVLECKGFDKEFAISSKIPKMPKNLKINFIP